MFNPRIGSGRWVRVPYPTPQHPRSYLRISRGALGTRFTLPPLPPEVLSQGLHYAVPLPASQRTHGSPQHSQAPFATPQTSSLRHLGPSPRSCWCPRFCRRRNRRTRVWFRSERLRQAAAWCVHSRALSPSTLPAARGGLLTEPAVWQFLQCALTNFLLRTHPPPPHSACQSHKRGGGSVRF